MARNRRRAAVPFRVRDLARHQAVLNRRCAQALDNVFHFTAPMDEALGHALRTVLRYWCPKCHHLAGYMTPHGIKCWWPQCGYLYPARGRDMGGFVDVFPAEAP